MDVVVFLQSSSPVFFVAVKIDEQAVVNKYIKLINKIKFV